MSRRFASTSILLLCVWVSIATGATLTAERTLRIEFMTTPPFVESLPNVLYAFLGNVNRIEPYNKITGQLYDGNQLLGESISTNGCCSTGTYSFHPVPVTWKAPGSPWDFPAGDPAVVEFESMYEGDIQGRIDIFIDEGSFELDLQAKGGVALYSCDVQQQWQFHPSGPGDSVGEHYARTPRRPPTASAAAAVIGRTR